MPGLLAVVGESKDDGPGSMPARRPHYTTELCEEIRMKTGDFELGELSDEQHGHLLILYEALLRAEKALEDADTAAEELLPRVVSFGGQRTVEYCKREVRELCMDLPGDLYPPLDNRRDDRAQTLVDQGSDRMPDEPLGAGLPAEVVRDVMDGGSKEVKLIDHRSGGREPLEVTVRREVDEG